MAIGAAQAEVQKSGPLAVPLQLRNAPSKLMKELDYGKGYGYSHEGEGNFIAQEFLPDEISGTKFYNPGENPPEERFKGTLKKLWKDRYDY